ncbi:MAG: hypothetical protein R3E31_26100 [Chloroflexota bacterium]
MFEQDRMLLRLQQRVLNDAAIAVCFLSGSYGRREADAYADLDVALVFSTTAARELAWQNRRAFVQSVLPYVPMKSFDAVHIRPYFHIALYSSGTKVDFRYETQDTLQPNPWDRDLRLLKDTENWGAAYQALCAQTMMPRPLMDKAELAALDERFWVMYWDVLRVLLRGDQQKPFTVYLELLHFTLPALLRVLPSGDPARRALLEASYMSDTKATAQHMKRLLSAYLAARTAVIRLFSLDFTPDRSFEEQIQRLVDRHVPA